MYKLMLPNEITDSDIQEVLDIEASVYKENEQQTLERCKQFFSINKDIYLFFKDTSTDEIVGNVNYMPVNENCYRMIRSGIFTEKDILPEMILPYGDMIYFSGITIRKEYRNSGLLKYMIKEFMHRSRHIKKIIADAVTDNGNRLCRLFGMLEVCKSNHNSTIYEKVQGFNYAEISYKRTN